MRLIDADALLEAYDKAHKGPPGAARKLIEDAPTVGCWTSANDRPPENQEPVIVYVPPHDDCIGYVGMAYYTQFGEGFWCGTDGNLYGAIGIIHPPTRWMPRPAPPEKT